MYGYVLHVFTLFLMTTAANASIAAPDEQNARQYKAARVLGLFVVFAYYLVLADEP